MIWIFHHSKASAASCNNYDELFQYIINIESLKFSGNPSEIGQSLLTKIIKEAHEKEVGCIAICQENSQNRIDMEAIKKHWCLAYCDAHGYIVVENLSYPHHSTQPIRSIKI